MIYYCTYCSKDKKKIEGKIKSLDLYISDRIKFVKKTADDDNAGFLIMSGKYGLLKPETEIEYYDKLLKPEDLEIYIVKLKKQLLELNAETIIFYHKNPEEDKNITTYINAIKSVADDCSVKIEFKIIENAGN